jgi:predicted ArsR family transcriptional regulator
MLTQSNENARSAIVAALEADSNRTNADIANSLGVQRAQVATIRTTLECTGAISSQPRITGPSVNPSRYVLKQFAALILAFKGLR